MAACVDASRMTESSEGFHTIEKGQLTAHSRQKADKRIIHPACHLFKQVTPGEPIIVDVNRLVALQ